MTDFAEFIASSRKRLLHRASEVKQELAQIEAELAGIDAYEQIKREIAGPPIGKTGRYPYIGDGTMSVPQAGWEFLGLSESGSWLAARRGDIPTLKISRYRRVPVAEMLRKLEERQAAHE